MENDLKDELSEIGFQLERIANSLNSQEKLNCGTFTPKDSNTFFGNESQSQKDVSPDEADKILMDVIEQSCFNNNPDEVDNLCMSAYEDACEYLERKGYLKSINGRTYKILKQENKSKGCGKQEFDVITTDEWYECGKNDYYCNDCCSEQPETVKSKEKK